MHVSMLTFELKTADDDGNDICFMKNLPNDVAMHESLGAPKLLLLIVSEKRMSLPTEPHVPNAKFSQLLFPDRQLHNINMYMKNNTKIND